MSKVPFCKVQSAGFPGAKSGLEGSKTALCSMSGKTEDGARSVSVKDLRSRMSRSVCVRHIENLPAKLEWPSPCMVSVCVTSRAYIYYNVYKVFFMYIAKKVALMFVCFQKSAYLCTRKTEDVSGRPVVFCAVCGARSLT